MRMDVGKVTEVDITEIPTNHKLVEEKSTMACVDQESCQFAKLYEFQMAQLMDGSRHDARRLASVNDFISTQTQINHLQEGTKVGTREAAAMQRMDSDKSAGKAMEMAIAAGARGN